MIRQPSTDSASTVSGNRAVSLANRSSVASAPIWVRSSPVMGPPGGDAAASRMRAARSPAWSETLDTSALLLPVVLLTG